MMILESLNSIAKKYKLPIIVSTHPRTKDRMDKLGSTIKLNPLVQFLKPLGFFNYIKLQKSSFCVISDSGTITEESSILKFPAIMIRQSHERPEGMDEGTVIMSGIDKNRVLESIDVITKQFKEGIIPKIIDDYDVINLHWVEKLLSNNNLYNLTSSGKNLVWTLHDMKPFTGGCHYSSNCINFENR